MLKVNVRKSDRNPKIVSKILELGENVAWRLCRPAWTSSPVTGGLYAFNHNHAKTFFKNYYKN